MTLIALWRYRYLIGAIGALVSLGGAYAYLRTHYYNEGFNAAISKIAAKDKEALNAVKKQLQIVDDCAKSGGIWDTTDGLCHR